MKRILITGAAGFLGRRLALALLEERKRSSRGQLQKLILLDCVPPTDLPDDPRLEIHTGDISDPEILRQTIQPGLDGVVHLAAVVSSAAEADFDLGMRVNLDGTRALLEACRSLDSAPRFLFASSLAVFGGSLPEVVDDEAAALPDFSYGIQKRICEMLIQEYHRREYIDGCVVRLPTIVIRPGIPNKAASSFVSSILREPLSGQPAICPVNRSMPLWILSPRRAIEGLERALSIDSDTLGQDRTLNLPGLSVTVEQMVTALTKRIGNDAEQLIVWRHNPEIENIVGSWPSRFATPRAKKLGFRGDLSIEEIIDNFVADDLARQKTLQKSV
ncbi:MAG: D-erythronate dehydrogenase [Rhodovibrionaceae bacterium]